MAGYQPKPKIGRPNRRGGGSALGRTRNGALRSRLRFAHDLLLRLGRRFGHGCRGWRRRGGHRAAAAGDAATGVRRRLRHRRLARWPAIARRLWSARSSSRLWAPRRATRSFPARTAPVGAAMSGRRRTGAAMRVSARNRCRLGIGGAGVGAAGAAAGAGATGACDRAALDEARAINTGVASMVSGLPRGPWSGNTSPTAPASRPTRWP